jgi:hypothetical protein
MPTSGAQVYPESKPVARPQPALDPEARAEHHRRQRELLVQRREQERQQHLHQFESANARPARPETTAPATTAPASSDKGSLRRTLIARIKREVMKQ